jgi:alanine racemase
LPRSFNTGKVYINGKLYPIVGKISMDSLTAKVDKSVKINDCVYVIKDYKHGCTFIKDYKDSANLIAVICGMNIDRVPRIEKKDLK